MSQAEHPDRLRPGHDVTVEDVRQLMGASTPHFALQLRERIRAADPRACRPTTRRASRASARSRGSTRSRYAGEVRGEPAQRGHGDARERRRRHRLSDLVARAGYARRR